MGNLLFVIFIILAVVIKVKKQNDRNTGYNGQKNGTQNNWQNVRPQSYQRNNTAQSYGQNARPQFNQRNNAAQSYGKNGRTQSYGSQNGTQTYSRPMGNGRRVSQKAGQVPYQQQRPASNDILSRAKSNVAETAEDSIKKEIQQEAVQNSMANASGKIPSASAIETMDFSEEKFLHNIGIGLVDINQNSDIMKQVNDLIVTGYSGNLAFERDFVAEGVDMLNSFELNGGIGR